MSNYAPQAYRDRGGSDDGDLRPAPLFTWTPAAPRHVKAAPISGDPLAPAQAPTPAQQRMQLAAAVAKKCLDLGLPRPPLARREAAPAQEPEPEQQQAYKQLAAATSQLQRQSGVLVVALESQAAQLAAQQRLLQDLVQGMLFVAAKTSSAPAVTLPPPLQVQPAARLGSAAPAAAAPVARQQQQRAVQVAGPALQEDLANILASQSQRAQQQCQQQQLHSGVDGARPCVLQITPLPTGLAGWEGPQGQPQPGSPASPRPTCSSQLRVARVAACEGEQTLGAQEAAGSNGGSPKRSLASQKQFVRVAARPQWDDSTVLAGGLSAARGRRRGERLLDPTGHPPSRRPPGASASMAAQLLVQELAKYPLKSRGRGPKPREALQMTGGARGVAAEAPASSVIKQLQLPTRASAGPAAGHAWRLSGGVLGPAAAGQPATGSPPRQHAAGALAEEGAAPSKGGGEGRVMECCGPVAAPPAGISHAPASQGPSLRHGAHAEQQKPSSCCCGVAPAGPPAMGASGGRDGSSGPPAAHAALPAAQRVQPGSAPALGIQHHQQQVQEQARHSTAGQGQLPVSPSHGHDSAAAASWSVQLPCPAPARELGDDELMRVCACVTDRLLLGEFLPCCAGV